jgi:hypothetical protein
MMRQPFDLIGQPVTSQRLDGLHGPGVEDAAPFLEETSVGYLLSEGMLKGVFQLREKALLIEELCGLQAGERAAEGLLGYLSDGLEQGGRARPCR